MASASTPSASTPSADEQAKDVFIHKVQISGRLISSGISDVAIASVYSKKTRPKKLTIKLLLLLVNEEKKGLIGMAIHFSKKYGNKG